MKRGTKLLGKETRDLDVKLDPLEQKERARELGELTLKLDQRKKDEKDEAARKKVELEELLETRTRLAQSTVTGVERRPIACEIYADYQRGLAVTVRTDTGAVVNERSLKIHEQQRDLPLAVVSADDESEAH